MVTLFCLTLERVDTLLKLSNRAEIVRYICQKLRQKARALTGSIFGQCGRFRPWVHKKRMDSLNVFNDT